MVSRSTWNVEEADMPAINPALFSLAMSCKVVQLTRLLNSKALRKSRKWQFSLPAQFLDEVQEDTQKEESGATKIVKETVLMLALTTYLTVF